MCIKHQVQELLLTQINMGHLESIAVLIVNSYSVIQENVCCIRVPAENIVPPGQKKKNFFKAFDVCAAFLLLRELFNFCIFLFSITGYLYFGTLIHPLSSTTCTTTLVVCMYNLHSI